MNNKQTMKNYHNSNHPPYQSLNPPIQPPLNDQLDSTKSSIYPEDLPNLQTAVAVAAAAAKSQNLSSQEEILKCFQAIYGKNNPELLSKLNGPLDWPMPSASPTDIQRLAGLASTSNSGHLASGLGASGSANFIKPNNNNNGLHNKNDLHYTNPNPHSHQSPANVNHYKASSSNMKSPQQQQQQLSQQKSVLSLHQHHQLNDLSNRRLNQHHMSTTNASFANLSNANATSASGSSATDTNNLSTMGGGASGSGLNGKNPLAPGIGPHVANIMDPFTSIDNMFSDGSLQFNKDIQATDQQTLIRHLLKATGGQLNPMSVLSSSPANSSSQIPHTIVPHRNDSQSMRNISTSNMQQIQHQSISHQPAISPPNQAAFSSVPKSLLNLAACSSSSPSSSNTESLPQASQISRVNNRLTKGSLSSHYGSHTNLNNNAKNPSMSSSSSWNVGKVNNPDYMGPKPGTQNSFGSNNQSTKSATSSQANLNSSGWSPSLKQLQLSLFNETEQNTPNINALKNISSGSSSTVKTSSGQGQRSISGNTPAKESFLANLQERAARAGVSIGEISKNSKGTNSSGTSLINNSSQLSSLQKNVINFSPNAQPKEDRREIESAISRVEARNDLSLLYPPMLLASNSQKQINALSAGLHETEESELFTKEVKRIVLEECNIIYECKECNNLFRSLANLVKHKRTYCIEHHAENEANKRLGSNTSISLDQSNFESCNPDTQHDEEDLETSHCMSLIERTSAPNISANTSTNSQGNSLKCLLGQQTLKTSRSLRSKDKRPSNQDGPRLVSNSSPPPSSSQTNLSRLLQTQPKSRVSGPKDSALLGALKMNGPSTNDMTSVKTSIFNYDNDKDSSNNYQNVNEQLVRNSSLAKTLLNEKVRSGGAVAQSLIELSKAESILQPNVKRPNPKRKFLEDCIRKVKRDKLFTGEEEDTSTQKSSHNASETLSKISPRNSQGQNEPQTKSMTNSPGDSDIDSDALMIDADLPKKGASPSRRGSRRGSNAASSTASSNSSTKLNTSSALLKALTRPVENKSKNYNPASSPVIEDRSINKQENVENRVERDSVTEDNQEQLDTMTELQDIPSPLFDNYSCDICNINFKDLNSLMSHTFEIHEKEKVIFPCLFCSLSFIALENVCRHIIDIHKKPKAQIHRLSEVVLSRSYVTNDFLACCDYPQNMDSHQSDSKEEPMVDSGVVIDPGEDQMEKASSAANSPSHDESASQDSYVAPKTSNNSNSAINSDKPDEIHNSESEQEVANLNTETQCLYNADANESWNRDDDDCLSHPDEEKPLGDSEHGDDDIEDNLALDDSESIDICDPDSSDDQEDNEDPEINNEDSDGSSSVRSDDISRDESANSQESVDVVLDNIQPASPASSSHSSSSGSSSSSNSSSGSSSSGSTYSSSSSNSNSRESPDVQEIEKETDPMDDDIKRQREKVPTPKQMSSRAKESESDRTDVKLDNLNSEFDIDNVTDLQKSGLASRNHEPKQGPSMSTGNKANTEVLSQSSGSGGGAASSSGLMKLKIQLKARTDEKSKVYEIV